MRKLVVGAVAAASLVGGSLALAVANPLGLAGAQDPPVTTTVPATTEQPAAPGQSGQPDGVDQKGGRRGPGGHGGPKVLEETLKELVAAGTINQSQSDAIAESLKNKMTDGGGPGGNGGPGGPGGHGNHGGHGGRGFNPRQLAETAAGVIGIDVDTLKTEIKSGKSMAEVAQAHGIDPQKVIDELVTKASAHIDEAVTAGKIPADRAATMKQELTDHITKLVNGHPGDGGKGGRPPK